MKKNMAEKEEQFKTEENLKKSRLKEKTKRKGRIEMIEN